jgi:hypothetical protein
VDSNVKFNVAVKVVSHGNKLMVEVPAKVAEALSLRAEDILCWTGLDDGSIEVWSVAKNPYQRLKDKEPGSGGS